jgi:hypothetical protein
MTSHSGPASGHALTAASADFRVARLVLAVVVVATTAFAIRYHDGHDFVNNIWAPIHGLLAGYNPYDTADIEYHLRYDVPVVAGLYLPTALLLHAPLALLSESHSADAMAALDAALIWFGVLLLILPRTSRACLIAGISGVLLVISAPAQDTIFLGQLSAAAFAGFALLAASLRKDPSAKWLPALGVTLVALKPQSAIPIFVALAVLQCWSILARAAALLAATSVPGAVLFVQATGGASGVIRTVTSNLDHLSRLPPNDLTNPGNIRIDTLGILSHLGGPSLAGLGWMVINLAVATALLVLALRAVHARGPGTLADPYVVMVVALYVVVALVHLSYDQLLLYLGPLAALGVITGSEAPSRRSQAVAAGGIALAAAGIVFRSGFRSRLMDSWLSFLPVHKIWIALPTLVVLAIVGCAVAVDRHTASSEITR